MVTTSKSDSRNIEVVSTDDGLHLSGSILWLDSHHIGDLSFLSSPSESYRYGGPQFLATRETIRILRMDRKKQSNALVCQYHHPISLGRLKIELLPSGEGLGSALLHIETGKSKILYAPSLYTQQTSVVPKIHLKKADTLILRAILPDPSLPSPNRKKEKQRLLAKVLFFLENGVSPTIVCRQTFIAQEVTALLTSHQISVATHPIIYRISKIYESSGSHLGRFHLFNRKVTKKNKKVQVNIFPLSKDRIFNRYKPKRPILLVKDRLGESYDYIDSFVSESNRFHLSSTCHIGELREVMGHVSPSQVYVFGPYTKRYVQELKNDAYLVSPLYPNGQPTLL